MAVKQKIKSSHDVLDDPRLLKVEILSNELVKIHYLFLEAGFNLSLPAMEFSVI